jgi:hypothetical protein
MAVESEDTLIGNELRLQVGDGASPETFVDFCSITDVSGFGESKPLVDVTSICDTARKFRNGLKEGAEVTLAANFIQGDEQGRQLFESYQADDIVNFKWLVNPGDSPQEYFAFSMTILGWQLAAPVGDKAAMTFTGKISGPVVWVHD